MKIQYCSDLHLEFKENKKILGKNPIKPLGEILILAGDIIPFAIMDKYSDFFDFVSDNFKFTYWIPGNHEYYYFDAAQKTGLINEKIRSNVSLVNNITIQQDDIRFVFSTLWAKISPANQWNMQKNVSDFKVIKFNGELFTPSHFNQLHQDCFNFIQQELKEPHQGKTVLVTHHVPTLFNYPQTYKGSILNEAFAVELFDFIEPSNIDYWIYGHHHNNIPDFEIGKTHLVTNQLGYVSHGENDLFSNKIIKC